MQLVAELDSLGWNFFNSKHVPRVREQTKPTANQAKGCINVEKERALLPPVKRHISLFVPPVHDRSPADSTTTSPPLLSSPGKCGHAYLVPHFTSSGYSGNLVEVELHTNSLGSVRLHGVVTDFADFYSEGGVGPYNGQVGTALTFRAHVHV